jgi:hypothetical protein
MSRLTYKQAVEALETALEAARQANDTVRAQFADLGGSEGAGGPVPDLIFKGLVSGALDAWRRRVAEAEAFLNG